MAPSLRTELLTEAERLVTGDRNATYGEPHQDFQRTADMLTAMGFKAPGGGVIEAHHVALLLMGVKMSRLVWSPDKRDSWVDLAGYAACGHEAYVLTRPEPDEDLSAANPAVGDGHVDPDALRREMAWLAFRPNAARRRAGMPHIEDEPTDGHHPRCDSPNLSHPGGCVPRSYQTGTEY